jgi:heme/copper-type cytochrome/quinol oxidase subunit 3
MESGAVAVGHAEEHHGHPPEANQSSRIDRQTLGILLFIVSEVMLFGAFFASYFFLRVVANEGPWPPDPFELPVAVAGMNTAILVSSSFTMHWALESIRRDNHRGLKMGLMTTFLLGATFLFIQVNETSTSASARATTPSARSSTASPGCTARMSRSACCCSQSRTSAPSAATTGQTRRTISASRCPGSTGTSST